METKTTSEKMRRGQERQAPKGKTETPTHPTSATLLLKTQEACHVLGGIHPRTLARLESRGLIRGVKLLRHKLYARADIEALVEEVRKWNH